MSRRRLESRQLLDVHYQSQPGFRIQLRAAIDHPRERPAGAEYIKAFAAEMLASGFLARSIGRHAVRGLAPVSP